MAAPQIIQPVDSQSGWGLVPALDGNIGTATPDPATGVSATSTQQSATTTTQAVIQAQTVPPVPASVPMLDANGYISPAWSAYFQSLMRRIGGYADIPWEDLFILSEQDTPLPDATARDMAQLSTLEVPQTPRQVDGDPFDAPRFPVAPDVDPFQIDRTFPAPDEDPFGGGPVPAPRVFGAGRIGLVPSPGIAPGVTKFLREDATWQAAGGGGNAITNSVVSLINSAGSNGAGNYSTGSKFYVSKDCTCTGIRFSGANPAPYTLRLWNSSSSILATVSATGGAGPVTGTFSSPVSLTAGTQYFVTMYNASTYWQVAGATPLGIVFPFSAAPICLIDSRWYAAGDAMPNTQSGAATYPVEPVLS